MKQQTRGSLMLLLCAMVWGAAFVAQSEGMNYVVALYHAGGKILSRRPCACTGHPPAR